jgi:hypothetical protein
MFTKILRFFGQILHPTMGCPNSKNRQKKGLRPLGVKGTLWNINLKNLQPLIARDLQDYNNQRSKCFFWDHFSK